MVQYLRILGAQIIPPKRAELELISYFGHLLILNL